MSGVPSHTHALPISVGVELGIAVLRNTLGGTHAGIVFRSNDGAHKFLHLRFDCDLALDAELPSAGLYGAPGVPVMLANHLFMLLDLVQPENQASIHYAFGYDGTTKFDLDEGTVRVGDGQIGLTCSTFVLAIFDSVGFPLVVPETFTVRDGDREVKDQLIRVLWERERQGRVSAGYTARVRAEAERCVRFRPEDVLAAATEPKDPPHEFDSIVERSAQIGAHVRGTSG